MRNAFLPAFGVLLLGLVALIGVRVFLEEFPDIRPWRSESARWLLTAGILASFAAVWAGYALKPRKG